MHIINLEWPTLPCLVEHFGTYLVRTLSLKSPTLRVRTSIRFDIAPVTPRCIGPLEYTFFIPLRRPMIMDGS
jgi:hypothetical protein